MKTKIHIDIGTYEFVEFELEENEFIIISENTKKSLELLYSTYHKMGDKIQLEQEKPKKVKREISSLNHLEAL